MPSQPPATAAPPQHLQPAAPPRSLTQRVGRPARGDPDPSTQARIQRRPVAAAAPASSCPPQQPALPPRRQSARRQPNAQQEPGAPQLVPSLPPVSGAAAAGVLSGANAAGATPPAGRTASQLKAGRRPVTRRQSDGGPMPSVTPAPAAAMAQHRLPGDGTSGAASSGPPAPGAVGGYPPLLTGAAARKYRRQRTLAYLDQKAGAAISGSGARGAAGPSQASEAAAQHTHVPDAAAHGSAAVASGDCAAAGGGDGEPPAPSALQAASNGRGNGGRRGGLPGQSRERRSGSSGRANGTSRSVARGRSGLPEQGQDSGGGGRGGRGRKRGGRGSRGRKCNANSGQNEESGAGPSGTACRPARGQAAQLASKRKTAACAAEVRVASDLAEYADYSVGACLLK